MGERESKLLDNTRQTGDGEGTKTLNFGRTSFMNSPQPSKLNELWISFFYALIFIHRNSLSMDYFVEGPLPDLEAAKDNTQFVVQRLCLVIICYVCFC